MVKLRSGAQPTVKSSGRKTSKSGSSVTRRLKSTTGLYDDWKKIYIRRLMLFLVALVLLAIGAYGIFFC